MAHARVPGPIGGDGAPSPLDDGTSVRALTPPPGPTGRAAWLSEHHADRGDAGVVAVPRAAIARPGLPVLRRGSDGTQVQRLQRLLNVRIKPGPALKLDGLFGPLTEQAVLSYQRGVDIQVDGVVGRQTWTRLLQGAAARVATAPAVRAAPQPAARGGAQAAAAATPGKGLAPAPVLPATPAGPPAAPAAAAPKPAVVDAIWEWPLQRKLIAVLERVPGRLPGQAKQEFLALLNLESLALMLAIIAGFCLLSGGTAFVLGMALLGIDVGMALASALQGAATAATEQELDEAADELAHVVITVGVAGFIKGVGTIAKGLRAKPGSSSAAPKAGPAPAPKPPAATPKPQPKPPPEVAPAPRPAAPAVAARNVVKSKGGHTYDLSSGDKAKPAKFGQRAVSPRFSTPQHGKGNPLIAGKSIDEVAAQLRNGDLLPSDLPVQYIWVNGEKVVVNNRSATTLSKAGIPQSKWRMVDMTGKLPDKGADSLPSVLERLDEMAGQPSRSMPVRETPDWSSPIKETVDISP